MFPILKKLRYTIALILLIGGPLHAFLITWLEVKELAIWREVLVAMLVSLIGTQLIIRRKLPKFDLLDWLIISYAGLAVVFLFFQQTPFSQWLLGVRFDIMPFVVLFAVRQVEWDFKDTYIRVVLGVAAIVLSFGIVHSLFLPQDFLGQFGYSQQQGTYQPELAISGCQYLEHTQAVCRATSTFASPMRYGAYLLLLLGLLIPLLKKTSRLFPVACSLLPLTLLNIGLTYSRASWIGAFFLLAVGLFLYVPQKMYRKIALSLAATIAAVVLGIFIIGMSGNEQTGAGWQPPSFIKTVFLRASSTSEHWESLNLSISKVAEKPFGLGLGTAGPASLRFEKLVTENWYFQIALEMGIVGLVLFVGILCAIGRKLYEKRENALALGLLLGLVGISLSGLFIHSFEETSVMLIFALFTGMKLGKSEAIDKN